MGSRRGGNLEILSAHPGHAIPLRRHGLSVAGRSKPDAAPQNLAAANCAGVSNLERERDVPAFERNSTIFAMALCAGAAQRIELSREKSDANSCRVFSFLTRLSEGMGSPLFWFDAIE